MILPCWFLHHSELEQPSYLTKMDLVSKPKTTAPIWAHFGFTPDDKGQPKDVDTAVCQICKREIPAKAANTTNLRNHLKAHHPTEFAEVLKSSRAAHTSSQVTIAQAFERVTKYKRDSMKWRTLTDSVTRYIAKEMQPFNTVEKPAFKEMLYNFDKQYELPGKTYISKTAIPNLYREVKDEILKDFKEIDFYSATTDMWSSVNMTPYMSLTVHYLTTDWTLVSKCLETRYAPENHTADTLSETLKCILSDWELDEKKISCITTDNGANIVAAVGKLGWPWLNCFGHNLHLAVTNAIASEKDRTARALGLCRNLVNTFSMSWLKRRDLKKAQMEADIPQHNLVLQIPAIRRVLIDDRKHGHLNPTWQDVSVLESINAALKPVADFTDVLSGEKYVTVSSVKPVLDLLKDELLSPDSNDTTLTSNIKKKMCAKRKAQPSTHGLTKREQADAELSRYLLEEALDNSADPLMWWRDNESRFPLISKLARKYMCICATSTASERMFSTAGNIVTPVRCCLKPEKVNMLVFLSRNLPSH
ncbi:E3 SUMO-protein ligase ZBED1 [Labeo rohita]|uniref:E3 SUMO-protein ligase ZBED1 n=1 Tax=Labeo rohita TaxID=84645 RepID=A0ABQ8M6S6_LABRO|nr:E3 SUMO-protein ligase ZBED1 [Labeo rohita]